MSTGAASLDKTVGSAYIETYYYICEENTAPSKFLKTYYYVVLRSMQLVFSLTSLHLDISFPTWYAHINIY